MRLLLKKTINSFEKNQYKKRRKKLNFKWKKIKITLLPSINEWIEKEKKRKINKNIQ